MLDGEDKPKKIFIKERCSGMINEQLHNFSAKLPLSSRKYARYALLN